MVSKRRNCVIRRLLWRLKSPENLLQSLSTLQGLNIIGGHKTPRLFCQGYRIKLNQLFHLWPTFSFLRTLIALWTILVAIQCFVYWQQEMAVCIWIHMKHFCCFNKGITMYRFTRRSQKFKILTITWYQSTHIFARKKCS